MNRDDILRNSIWTEGKMVLFSPFFEQEVTINLYTSEKALRFTESIISERFVQTVNDFLNLPAEVKPRMADLLYRHCLACCESISYGVDVLEGETETEANLRAFGVQSKEDAFDVARANLRYVSVEEDATLKNRFVSIQFYPAWEDEHGCALLLKNGELLDFTGESGVYLRQFDD